MAMCDEETEELDFYSGSVFSGLTLPSVKEAPSGELQPASSQETQQEGHTRRSLPGTFTPSRQRQPEASAAAPVHQQGWFERNLHDFISVFHSGGSDEKAATPTRQHRHSSSNMTGSFIRSRNASFGKSDAVPGGSSTLPSILSPLTMPSPTAAAMTTSGNNTCNGNGEASAEDSQLASLSPRMDPSFSSQDKAHMLRRGHSDRGHASPPSLLQQQQHALHTSKPAMFRLGGSERLLAIPDSAQEVVSLKVPRSSVPLECLREDTTVQRSRHSYCGRSKDTLGLPGLVKAIAGGGDRSRSTGGGMGSGGSTPRSPAALASYGGMPGYDGRARSFTGSPKSWAAAASVNASLQRLYKHQLQVQQQQELQQKIQSQRQLFQQQVQAQLQSSQQHPVSSDRASNSSNCGGTTTAPTSAGSARQVRRVVSLSDVSQHASATGYKHAHNQTS